MRRRASRYVNAGLHGGDMKQVWLLWGSDTEKPWVEQVFVDKVIDRKSVV